MPLYFFGFLATLGAAALLYVAALVTLAARRRPLPTVGSAGAAETLQLLVLALLWFNVGVCWLAYFNVYRIHVDMAALGNVALQAFAHGYVARLPVVVLPFGAGALAASLALWARPGRFSRRAPWGIATLWMLALAVTPLAAGAQGDMHDQGFTQAAFDQLQAAHLVRSLSVSVAAVWALLQMRQPRA